MKRSGRHPFRVMLLAAVITAAALNAEQRAIPRVEQMPNLPQPYLMRDWKQTARDYDSLVFDISRTGTYLPLVWINNSTVNYPSHSSFGLHTVVGTPYPYNAEGINALAAVVSASLAGIDKSDQFGTNWVLGCEEWFNRRPEENVYLNNYAGQSGDDWWYHTMPNIFFYQIYDLYPGTGDFEYQLRSVADQWLKAVETMGGSDTPWSRAFMDYRGWYLSTMTPHTSGVREPEAAGAIAWLLYNAYTETGDERYRKGAEWAMEFLSAFSSNASYELQLPYGVYTAARMNAELGTSYDVEKMLNWCFDPDGNVRQWGVTLGNWGGYDCDGLVGEALNDGYAFAMNGYEMAGALVPMLRYDDRFARGIGKWVLNLANASRLFYAGYLPAENQDGESWAWEYDTLSCIAHESMREFALGSGVSPFATGDAISGGWGATNFALYGSSHVGLLGGIVDTTDVPGILRLDLRATDFFQENAYPSFLLYNPYMDSRSVVFDAGDLTVDLYDALTNTVLLSGVSGEVSLDIPADAALQLVLIPSGTVTEFRYGVLYAGGIPVDYSTDSAAGNRPPRLKSFASPALTVPFGGAATVYCTAADPDGDALSYAWTAGGATLSATGPVLQWQAPYIPNSVKIRCTVSDGKGGSCIDSLTVTVVPALNHAPVISWMKADPGMVGSGDSTRLSCKALDADGDALTFSWSTAAGNLEGADSVIFWTAPAEPGYYYVRCRVSDPDGEYALDSLGVAVKDSAGGPLDNTVAYWPLDGDGEDHSGLDNNGINHGAVAATDRFGVQNAALYFNGSSANVQVPVSPSLNFTGEITVSFWMSPAELYSTRESYPVSHGNWENRWKISILPEKKLRWTVKTANGVRDVDSQTEAKVGSWMHVAGTYDGGTMRIYINGIPEAQASLSGSILTTAIDLMLGQVLPSNTAYNFKGSLDEVRIYDTCLSAAEILSLYSPGTAADDRTAALPDRPFLYRNHPNPFNPVTAIDYFLPAGVPVRLSVFDIRGRLVCILDEGFREAGMHSLVWDAADKSSGIYFYRLESGGEVQVGKCIILK